ncbi:MAG: glycosyltransferase family 2 protein [Bacteroidaceae bacterium]|nr:glycosyltransferase family 2 protein [Bacteroidaceae bacterium]
MLSLLIPTYNFDCLPFIKELAAQCEAYVSEVSDFAYEIIVFDDASTDSVLANRLESACAQMAGVRWLKAEYNVGRARARNRLLAAARGEWVLMMDDDARLVDDRFIARYWEVRYRAEVLCGDLVSPAAVVSGHELRHRYERSAAPMRTADRRNQHPYERFTTFNLFARKASIAAIGFDEGISEYGYEDVLLGIELQERGVSVLHIDNPLLHTGIDSNASFLSKTRAAMRTLSALPLSVRRRVGASRLSLELQRRRLRTVVALILKPLLPLLERQLLSHHPNLQLLKLYKLGYYLNISAADSAEA